MALIKYITFILFWFNLIANLYSQNTFEVYDSLWNKLKRYDSDSLIYIENKSNVKSIIYFSNKNNEKFPIFSSYDSVAVIDFFSVKNIFVDKSIENLKCLKVLDFQLVNKVVFHKSIKRLPSLQVLRLSQFQYFKHLPNFIYSCNELQYLSVRVTDTGSVDFRCLASLTKLKVLDLSFKKISSFPKKLTELNSLEYLSIFSNKTFFVDKSILSLSNLKCLSLNVVLNDNLLNILSEMPNLEGLVVDSIALNKLDDIKKLNHLKSFYVLKLDNMQKEKILTIIPSTHFGHWFSLPK